MQESKKTTTGSIGQQKRAAHKFRHGIYGRVKPSCFHTWHWSEPSFEESAKWMREHNTEIRHGVYLSDTPGKEVWIVEIPQKVGGEKVVLTSFVTPKTFWDTFAFSEAWKELRNSMVMKHLGIPTSKPLACGEIRFCGRVIKSYIVMEYQPGCFSGKLLMPGGQFWDQKEKRIAFSRKAMELLAKVHRCDYFHHDFHPSKILMSEKSTEQDMHLMLIDISMADFRPMSMSRKLLIAEDLLTFFVDMRLSVSEIKDVCKGYLECNPNCGYTVDSLWDQLVMMGRRKWGG